MRHQRWALLCFLTLGIFWIGRQTQLNLSSRSDRNLNTYVSIAFIVLLQVNCAIAPRIKPLSQL